MIQYTDLYIDNNKKIFPGIRHTNFMKLKTFGRCGGGRKKNKREHDK